VQLATDLAERLAPRPEEDTISLESLLAERPPSDHGSTEATAAEATRAVPEEEAPPALESND
jgi:hypothetical protein